MVTTKGVRVASGNLCEAEAPTEATAETKPEITDALSRGRMLPEANGYADIGFEEAGKHHER